MCTVWSHRAHNLSTMARRLGIVYCLNRPCALYSIKVPFICKNNSPADSNPQGTCLTEGLLSAMSPKFSPKGNRLIFLSHDAAASSGVHCATAALKTMLWMPGSFPALHDLLWRMPPWGRSTSEKHSWKQRRQAAYSRQAPWNSNACDALLDPAASLHALDC